MTQFSPVDAPPVDRPLVNLLAAARTPQGESVRWQEGSVYESWACSTVRTLDTCDPSVSALVKQGIDEDDPEGRRVEATAVYAEASYECTYLPGLVDTYRDRALSALDAELPRAVEHELWTGAIARGANLSNRYLIDPARVTVLNGGTAVKPTAALGLLEDALGDHYSGVGIVHCNRHALNYLPGIARNGRIIESRVGNRVVPGVGYPGLGPATGPSPDGVVPGTNEEWLYITPMVTVRVGAPEVLDRVTVDRMTNRASIRARAPFEVSWDGCSSAFAILMQTVVEATP